MGHYFTNENLPSDIRENICVVLGKKFKFLTDNGVFSKDGLDFGSRYGMWLWSVRYRIS